MQAPPSYNAGMQSDALILFAHGSRDARWAEPFARILALVEESAPQRQPLLAFLEIMQPSLEQAVAAQVARGFAAISVVPLFLGLGGHLRRDVPILLEDIRKRHPGVTISLTGAAGEDPGVVASIAGFCTHAHAGSAS